MIRLISLPNTCPLSRIALSSAVWLTILPTVLTCSPVNALPAQLGVSSDRVLAQKNRETAIQYKMPSKSPGLPRSGPSKSGGTRGASCSDDAKGNLTILAPFKSEGKTASTRPTFAWYMPDAKSYPTKFMLFEHTGSEQRQEIYQEKGRFARGIKQMTLPSDQPALVPGKQYTWQVAVICDELSPSKTQVTETVFQVEPMPADLKKVMATAKDPLQRAAHYAESGFWYDALAAALNAPDQSAKISLLEQLAQIEAVAENATQQQDEKNETRGNRPKEQQHSDRLKQVIEFTNNPG